MAIPASGEISFNLFNTDRSIASATLVDMAAAGSAYGVSYATNGSNQLGMDEFYGKSAGGTPAPTTAPPTTAPPPPPPPVVYDWYDYERCVNPNAYEGGIYSISVVSGNAPPSTILVSGDCHSIVSYTPSAFASYTIPSYTVPGIPCACL